MPPNAMAMALVSVAAFHDVHLLGLSAPPLSAALSLLVINQRLAPADESQGAEHLRLDLDRNVEVLRVSMVRREV